MAEASAADNQLKGTTSCASPHRLPRCRLSSALLHSNSNKPKNILKGKHFYLTALERRKFWLHKVVCRTCLLALAVPIN